MQINKERVSVFISSRCDSVEDKKNGTVKYGVMRKSLKLMLEETGICNVYAFEESHATTVDVVHSYMDKLDDADLVIIIIDNKDGVSNATLKEISRAKAHNKKCIYIFCNEREKEATDVQKNLLSSLKNPRYYEVGDFTDIAKNAYEAVISDIIGIFNSYCRGRVEYREEDEEKIVEENSIDLEVAGDTDLTKEFIAGFAYTKYIAKKASGLAFGEMDEATLQDKNCASLLGLILGQPDDMNMDYESIKNDIKTYHRGNIQKIVIARYDALELYFSGKLSECVDKLSECAEMCKGFKNIPKWLYNDVALDLRNLQIELDKEKDVYSFNSSGQELLNQDKEPLYYPVIDRIVSEHNESLYKHLLKNATQSPFAVNIGGADYSIDRVCNSFIVAYAYGSITHMLLIRKRLYEYLIALSLEVRDHRMFMLCVRLLVLSGEAKTLKNYLQAYGENTNNINAQDVKKLLESVNYQPIEIQQIIAKELLLQHFGYYYSDDDFKSEYDGLIDKVKECIADKYAVSYVIKPLLDAYYDIRYRIDENDIFEFVYFLHGNNIRLYYDDAFKLLYHMQLKNVSKENQRKYQAFIIKCLENKEVRERCNNLSLAAQTLRQVETIGHSKLDACVKKTCPAFYEDTYLLNTSDLDETLGWSYIEKYIDAIKKDNATQGKNGTYYGNIFNPYTTIGRIISKTELKLNSKQLKMLVDVLKETLFAGLQTVDAKVNAMELLCILQLRNPRNKMIKKLVADININSTLVFQGKEMFMEKGYSSTNIQLMYALLQNILKKKFWKRHK
ncbi:SIS domain-containing protein [Lachnospiraceae bacterium JC7]|nr:SIS domain-containing protein [Lachnospiraceae bacterium JC7]